MARYNFSPEEQQLYQSIFDMRQQASQFADIRRQEYLDARPTALMSEAERAWNETKRNVSEEIRKRRYGAGITSTIGFDDRPDEIKQEVRKMKENVMIAANVGIAVGLMISACAAEADYNRHILAATDQAAAAYNDKQEISVTDTETRKERSLAEYQTAVSETRSNLESTQNAFYVEYKHSSDTAKAVIDRAQSTYEDTTRKLASEERRIDSIYKTAITPAQAKLDEIEKRGPDLTFITQTRDSAVSVATTRYESAVAQINLSLPESARAAAIREAATVRDAEIKTANNNFDTESQKVKAQYTQEVNEVKQYIQKIEDDHKSKLVDLEDRRVTAKDTYNRTVQEQTHIIKAAQISYTTAVKEQKNEMHNADMRLVNYQKNEASIIAAQTVTAEAALSKYMMVMSPSPTHGEDLANAAAVFVDRFAEKHEQISLSLIDKFGTEKEKQLIRAVLEDNKLAREAEEKGLVHTTQISENQRRDAMDIARKYGGDITTETGMAQTLTMHQTHIKNIEKDSEILTSKIDKNNLDIKEIDTKINKLRSEINSASDADKILRIGKKPNGQELTPEERKMLQDRVTQAGNLTNKIGEVKALEAQKVKLVSKNKNLDEKILNNKALIKGLQNEMNLLQGKQGEAVLSAVKSLDKQIAKANKEASLNLPGKHGKEAADAIKKLQKRLGKTDGLSEQVAGQSFTNAILFRELSNTTNRAKLTANTMSAKGEKKSMKSDQKLTQGYRAVYRKISRSWHQGDLIYSSTKKDIRNLESIGRGYNTTLAIARLGRASYIQGMQTFGKSRIGSRIKEVSERRMAQLKFKMNKKLTAKLGEKNMQRLGKAGNFIGKSTRFAGKMTGKALDGVGKVFSAPDRLKKKVRDKTFSMVKTSGQKVARMGGRVARRVAQTKVAQKIASTKIYKATSAAYKAAAKVTAKVLSKLISPIKSLISMLTPIISSITAAITSFLSAAVSFLTTVLSVAATAFVIIILVLLALSLLLSVLAAILDLWQKVQIDNISLVKNNPGFILNHAVNYRDAELEIFELFDEDNVENIKVSTTPVYDAIDTTGFSWPVADATVKMEQINQYAKEEFYNLISGKDSATINGLSLTDALVTTTFTNTPKQYDNVSLKYFSIDQVDMENGAFVKEVRGGVEQYRIDDTIWATQSSDYELSNAKDALSMVDALFSQQQNTMQQVEVLAYLGVKEYQLGSQEAKNSRILNLFWASHNIVVKNGNDPSDIRYHMSVLTSDSLTEMKYSVDTSHFYNQDTGGATTANVYSCPDAKTAIGVYNIIDAREVPKHKTIDDFTASAASDYKVNTSALYTERSSTTRSLASTFQTANELYYRSIGSNYQTAPFSRYGYKTSSVSLYYKKTGGGTGYHSQNIYLVGSKDVYASDVNNSLSKVGLSSYTTLTFVRSSGNTYHVVANNGTYLGKMNVRNCSSLWGALTSVQINNTTTATGLNVNNNGVLTLEGFKIYRTSTANSFKFDMYGYKSVTSTSTAAYVKDSVNGSVTKGNGTIVSSQKYYVNYLYFFDNKLSISCNHMTIETTTIPKVITYEFCPGHVDLDVGLVVTLNTPEKQYLYDAAQNVNGIPEDYQPGHFLWLFTFDDGHGNCGFGTVTQKAFFPAEDWADESTFRDLAAIKTEATVEYPMQGNQPNKIWMNINHTGKAGETSFKSIGMSPYQNLVLGMKFGNDTYYVESFVSGEQKYKKYYLIENASEGITKFVNEELAFEIDSYGRPVVKDD